MREVHAAFPARAGPSFAERAEKLIAIADALAEDTAGVAARSRLFMLEHGKIPRETRRELSRLGEMFRQSAGYGERLARDEALQALPFDTIVMRQPCGVAALIVPWNWPLSILGAKLPQALVTGNTVVVKPAQNASLVTVMTLQIIARLLPPGVVNVVTGAASEIGDALVGHPLVRKVNFTGSTTVGKHVGRVALGNVTPVTLELGGNDAARVLEDAELDDAAFVKMKLGGFAPTGQICTAM